MPDPNNPFDKGEVSIEHKGDAHGSEHDRGARTGRTAALEDIATSVKDFANRLPDQIGRVVESAQSALQSRANAITIHVDDESQRKIDQLVEAGVFRNRSESAAFLVTEGLKARSDLFGNIASRISEIERLRSEMRAMITPDDITRNIP